MGGTGVSMDENRMDGFDDRTPDVAGELALPAVPDEPARREPTWLLVVGIVLFVFVLALAWGQRFIPGVPAQQPTAATAQARLSTAMVLYLSSYMQGAEPKTRQQLTPARKDLAAGAAAQWLQVSKEERDPTERGKAALSAAALHGVAGDMPKARQALETAAARDPANADRYRALRPLYAETPTAPELSPDVLILVDATPASGLIRARTAELRGDTAGAAAALSAAAAGMSRWMVVMATVFTVYGAGLLLGFLAALVVFILILVRHPVITPPKLPASWGPGGALVTLAAYLFVSIPFALVFSLGARALGLHGSAVGLAIQGLALACSAVVVVGTFLVFTGRGFWAWGALGWRYTRGSALAGVVGLLAIVPLLFFVALITARLVKPESHDLVSEVLAPGNPWWVGLVMLVIAVVIAPVVEETLYRGILFPALQGNMSGWAAAVLSGALFASVHGQVFVLLLFTILGTLFAYLYWRMRSLWASTVAHAVFNGASTVIVLVLLWATRGPT
jgi:membrane protease YdiL (CAAX protease family)